MVFDDFPSPIAHYFYRFENGYESELQRFHFLRDTWEALVDLLHALAISESRLRGRSLANPMAFSDVLSDRVAQRLLNIERIVGHAISLGISLSIAKIVTVASLSSIRELNQTRNGFSHCAAQSEAQARTWISECYEDVIDVLDDLRGLADIEILRYTHQVAGIVLRCETSNGHDFTRTIQNIEMTLDQVRESQRYFRKGQVLACCGGSILSLRPLVHYREDASGYVTKLCMFRRTFGNAPNRCIEYEV